MDTQTALVGMQAFILIVTAVLTLFVSTFLLWLYRRATLRGMAQAAGSDNKPQPNDRSVGYATALNNHPTSILNFHETTDQHSKRHDLETGTHARTVLDNMKRSHRCTTLVYLAGGLAYAFVMTIAWLIMSGGPPPLSRTLLLIIFFLWPTVITLSIVTAIGIRDVLFYLCSYCILLALTIYFTLQRNPDLPFTTPLYLWAIFNLIPSVFFLFFLHNRIRSVGPIVFIFLLCGVSGAVVLVQLIGNNDASLSTIASAGHAIGINAISVFILMHLIGFTLFAFAGRFLLHRLGDAYKRKLCSDISITTDSMWLMFAVIQSIGFVLEDIRWILTAPIAFMSYRLVVSLGFRWIHVPLSDRQNFPNLLLLRVFSLGRRSNRFFDKFSKLWRQVGVIDMIAGPDLVTTAIEPHEFLEFAGGNLSRRFVLDEDDLNQRLHARDQLPDPDGRYRVHEFFCHDDTWQMTMQTLANSSDAILMDLRSFSSINQGCIFEISVLLEKVDLSRIVFFVDETTDRAFLEQTFQSLWKNLSPLSPNSTSSHATISLFTTELQNRTALHNMIGLLLIPPSPHTL
ncbi:MAG: hypothetical protein AB8B87_17065 [Granulosicoccus sp.]